MGDFGPADAPSKTVKHFDASSAIGVRPPHPAEHLVGAYFRKIAKINQQ